MSRSDVTPGLQHADKLRRADPNRELTIGVNLALRNEAQLEAFIAQVSDRKSPNYGRYLTQDQFAATYGPRQAQVQSVVDHLGASGLTVGSVSTNRTIIEATGPLSAVEAAFGVTISDWHDRDQNRDFFGNETEPTLPAAIASYVVGVAGLNDHYPLHRLGPAPRVGGGPAGGYTPTELKKAYDVTPLASEGYNGSGQKLGLFELDGFRQTNITAYDSQYALGSPAPTKVVVSGGPNPPLGGGEIEVELDIEVMHAIAPASPITVWEGPNSDPGANATYNAMVTSNTTKSNSTSWGICEPLTTASEMTTLDNIFKQGAAQGQSFFAASGDNGAYDCGDSRLTVDSPANDPYMTGTGGTNLALNADSSYKSESAWSNPNSLIGTGGGLSGYFARPSWQTGPGVANTYSNGKRQVPDVALDADPQTGYSVYVTYLGVTGWNVVGGTSAAAPAWAAFTSLYNQYAAAYSKPNLGYANPTLYSTGSFAQAYPPYHDITTGDNLYYPTTANWDYPTGWGSFDANNLARDVAGTLALTSVLASNITATSAVIMWQTDHPANSVVDYGKTTSYGSRVVDTTNTSNHSLTLSGLTDNTTYHYRATSTDAYGNSGSSSDGTFTTFSVCASGWSCADIGSPTPVGSQSLTGGTWTVQGGGADIWGSTDQFHFVWQSLAADGGISARIVSQSNSSPWAKAGVMLRQSSDPPSAFYAALTIPAYGIVVAYRPSAGASTVWLTSISGAPPAYLQVARVGSSFGAYISNDGLTWNAISGSAITLSLTGSLLQGVAVTSHNSNLASTVTVDSASAGISPPSPAANCASGWSCADLGNPTPIGSQSVNNGTWTIQGGGADIWGSSDQFHFVWQGLAADGGISARILSQSNSSPWAKAGVMLRQGSDPTSAFYTVLTIPAYGIVVAYRPSAGASTVWLTSISGIPPAYLRVARLGGNFGGYTSNDGLTWTAIPGSAITLSLTGSLLQGVAVTSHNSNLASTATVDSVKPS